MSKVFIAFQANEETRPIVEAIQDDNPSASIDHQPAMVKIDAEGPMVIRRSTIEQRLGRPYDLTELQVNLITLSGNVTEDDDEFTLHWNS